MTVEPVIHNKYNMKEKLKLIALLIYPIAYFLYISPVLVIVYSMDHISEEGQTYILAGIIVLYNLLVLFLAIHNSIVIAKGRYSTYEAAKMNLKVKIGHIPGYIINFCIGYAGYSMGERGSTFFVLPLIVSVACIILSGINSIGCTIRMKKDGVLSTYGVIIAGIGCYIWGIDVIIAIVYQVKSKRMEMY